MYITKLIGPRKLVLYYLNQNPLVHEDTVIFSDHNIFETYIGVDVSIFLSKHSTNADNFAILAALYPQLDNDQKQKINLNSDTEELDKTLKHNALVYQSNKNLNCLHIFLYSINCVLAHLEYRGILPELTICARIDKYGAMCFTLLLNCQKHEDNISIATSGIVKGMLEQILLDEDETTKEIEMPTRLIASQHDLKAYLQAEEIPYSSLGYYEENGICYMEYSIHNIFDFANKIAETSLIPDKVVKPFLFRDMNLSALKKQPSADANHTQPQKKNTPRNY